jgi:hypothetical protein
MRGRGCIVSAGAPLLARALTLASIVLLAGCDLLQDATTDPWQGYAWQKEEGRFEWVLVSAATHRECLAAIRNHLEDTEDGRLRYSPRRVAAITDPAICGAGFSTSCIREAGAIFSASRATPPRAPRRITGPCLRARRSRRQASFIVLEPDGRVAPRGIIFSADDKRIERWLAEREGFEPPIRLPVCRISSAVLSTTQPPLQPSIARDISRRWPGTRVADCDLLLLIALRRLFRAACSAASTTPAGRLHAFRRDPIVRRVPRSPPRQPERMMNPKIVVTWPKVRKGLGFPARAFAILP